MSSLEHKYVLVISCPDAVGIVAAVAGLLTSYGAFISDSSHFGDPLSGRFFMRTSFQPPAGAETLPIDRIEAGFQEIAPRFQMDWHIHDALRKPRLLILVSKFGHCLNDLLYRYRTGTLAVEIPAVVSNHGDFARLVAWHDIPFHELSPANKERQEAQILDLVNHLNIDLIVLARYMQVLSPSFCRALEGRCINIHHSFLPSFKGAKPYHQAHARGVKLIGATAHYVTPDLDEGPIIDQQAERVDHTHTPEDLIAMGRDIENVVLARAVRYHVQHRVLLNGCKTVVFR